MYLICWYLISQSQVRSNIQTPILCLTLWTLKLFLAFSSPSCNVLLNSTTIYWTTCSVWQRGQRSESGHQGVLDELLLGVPDRGQSVGLRGRPWVRSRVIDVGTEARSRFEIDGGKNAQSSLQLYSFWLLCIISCILSGKEIREGCSCFILVTVCSSLTDKRYRCLSSAATVLMLVIPLIQREIQ